MDQSQRQSMKMIFVLMVSAVFCAVATFVALALVIDRSNSPTDSADAIPIVITVAGTPVALYPDPNKTILLVSEAGTPVAPESGNPEQATADAVATEVILVTVTPVQPLPSPTPLPPPPTPVPPSVIFTSYVVQPGDSLYRITQVQNTSIDLMALHGISSSAMVAGNVLNLPIANPAYCPGMIPHVVRDQQTVYSIGQEYGSSPDAIAAVNGLDANYSVKTTQVLCIP
jgi:LysM repeat protein